MTQLRRLWLYTHSIAVMLFLMIPSLIVVSMSSSASFPPRVPGLGRYGAYFGAMERMDAAAVSFTAATMLVPLILITVGPSSSTLDFTSLVLAYAILTLPLVLITVSVVLLLSKLLEQRIERRARPQEG